VRDIWVTSDTHFQHASMLKWDTSSRSRHFTSVEVMDEILVENWNSVAKPGDLVYHLGDVFFGSKDTFRKLWPRLNGGKRLVIGNHDDVKFLVNGEFFQKFYVTRVFKEFGVIFSHLPLHPNHMWGLVNVHGHTHDNSAPTARHRCVCVEQTNYTPVHIDTLRVK